MPSLDELAFAAEHDIGRTRAFFPIMGELGNAWAASRPFSDATIGANLHLTTLTAGFLRELALGGARVVVSAVNPGTTDAGTVQLLRNTGIEVYTGGDMEDRHRQVLDHHPQWLLDASFDLIASALNGAGSGSSGEPIRGAAVLTRTAVDRLRALPNPPPFPVLNILNGRLRDAVDNKQGIGEAVWQAVTALTGMHLSGRRAVVIGYGPVGRGVASWGRSAGMAVEVVETDPVRALYAHYDGLPTASLHTALSRAQVVVTATGRPKVLTCADLAHATGDLILLNAGTGGDEVDVKGIQHGADGVDHIADDIVRYTLPSGHHATVLGHGHPLNIVQNSGSPEPVLLQFTLAGLALAWLVAHPEGSGEVGVPPEVEAHTAKIALHALERAGK